MIVNPVDPTETPAWRRLEALAVTVGSVPIRDLIAQDRGPLRYTAASWHLDLSRQRITVDVLAALQALAAETHVVAARDAMRAGEHVNVTEDRAVLHMALRAQPGEEWADNGIDVTGDVASTLARMEQIAQGIRSGELRGFTGRRFTRVINIGIGGSDLGPAMAYQAMGPYRDPGISCRFVSNVDPADIHDALSDSDPAETLIIVASKTFTTRETMANAEHARAWISAGLGSDAVGRHFVAVSTHANAVTAFGIPEDSMVGFWEWVGGRYSVDSAIGLSLMIAIGPENFRDFLRGFHDMDRHFLEAPVDRNLPLLMALCGIWNRNFLGIESVAVLPYSHRLARFPAYLQQLVMESNGKSVRWDGLPVTYATSPVYWGEPGTNGQHSFFQLLHQGTSEVASDILIVADPATDARGSQDALVANALAQASVLSVGRTADEVRAAGTPPQLIPHKVMPGNRPVSVLMTAELTPRSLGSLIGLYEHAVFVQGVVWGINSFDQWGVELGKGVAVGIEEDIQVGRWDDPTLDHATRASLRQFLELRNPSG